MTKIPMLGDAVSFSIKHKASLVLALWILLFSEFSYAAAFTYAWNIGDLARVDAEQVGLRGKSRKALKTVSTAQMRSLHEIYTRMQEVAEIEADLYIVDGNEPNAFAGQAAGDKNIVALNFAMLDILGMDVHTAAALFGHELAHLRLEHGDKKQSQSAKYDVLKILGSAALDSFGVPASQMISNLTFTSIETKYSRDMERQADYLGAIWAIEAGYEPDGAVRLQEEIHKRSGSGSVPFLSSHPSGPERIATLKSLSQRLSK